MTDRELLELAAKAAGIDGTFRETPDKSESGIGIHYGFKWWNPLTDGGDALWLAVKLGIDISRAQDDLHTEIGNADYHIDRYTSTRRAIVRAAAEIGKGMK